MTEYQYRTASGRTVTIIKCQDGWYAYIPLDVNNGAVGPYSDAATAQHMADQAF